MPAATRSSVVLPLPDGPEQAHHLGWRDLEGEAPSAMVGAVAPLHPLEGEPRGNGGGSAHAGGVPASVRQAKGLALEPIYVTQDHAGFRGNSLASPLR